MTNNLSYASNELSAKMVNTSANLNTKIGNTRMNLNMQTCKLKDKKR